MIADGNKKIGNKKWKIINENIYEKKSFFAAELVMSITKK
jgi:hypothetical protein